MSRSIRNRGMVILLEACLPDRMVVSQSDKSDFSELWLGLGNAETQPRWWPLSACRLV